MGIFGYFISIIMFVVLFFFIVAFVLCLKFWNIISALLGGKNTKNNRRTVNTDAFFRQYTNEENTKKKPTITGTPKPRNSPFEKDEGEYVDFEEIKG